MPSKKWRGDGGGYHWPFGSCCWGTAGLHFLKWEWPIPVHAYMIRFCRLYFDSMLYDIYSRLWIKQQPFQIRNTYQQTRNTLVRIISWSLHHIWIVIESSLSQYISTYFFRCSRNVVSSAWMPGLPSRSRCVCGRGWRFTLTTVKPLSVWLRPWLRATLSPFNQVPWCAFSRRFFLGGWNHEPCLMAWFTFFWELYCSEVDFFWVASNIKKRWNNT